MDIYITPLTLDTKNYPAIHTFVSWSLLTASFNKCRCQQVLRHRLFDTVNSEPLGKSSIDWRNSCLEIVVAIVWVEPPTMFGEICDFRGLTPLSSVRASYRNHTISKCQ